MPETSCAAIDLAFSVVPDYVEWLLLFREIGGPGGLFQSVDMRTMSPQRFFGRMFDPRHLLELSERNPEGALTYLQILRELGGGRFHEEFAGLRIDPKAMHRMFDPRQLLELSERNPEGALTYLQILRELDGGRFFEEFFARGMPPDEFFERFFHPRRLLELSDRNPEGALAYQQILRELGGGRFFEECFARGMPPDEFFERFFHPRRLRELSMRNLDGALTFLQILRELGGRRFFEEFVGRRMTQDLIDFMFDVTRIKHFPGFRIEQFAVLLAIARLSNSDQAIRKLSQIMQSSFASSPHSISQLSNLPIAALPDLRWFAEQGDLEEIRSFVDKLSN